jgi:hypothetical protein
MHLQYLKTFLNKTHTPTHKYMVTLVNILL